MNCTIYIKQNKKLPSSVTTNGTMTVVYDLVIWDHRDESTNIQISYIIDTTTRTPGPSFSKASAKTKITPTNHQHMPSMWTVEGW